MKKLLILLAAAATLASCSVQRIPEMSNIMNRAQLSDLNLRRADYEILNSVTAEASVIVTEKNDKNRQITELNNEFSMDWVAMPSKKGGGWLCKEHRGIVRLGWLAGESYGPTYLSDPVRMVERLALYRALNLAQQEGGDAVVEPIYTVSLEESGRKETIYKATVSAKVIKLKTDR